jgi:linoleoyl-CoA desaturase
MIGMSSYIWKLKHNTIHHNSPNLQRSDFDIEADPIIRFSPADTLRPYHKYQHFYAPFIYLLFSITLVFLSDIKIMFLNRRESIDGKRHPAKEKAIFLIGKASYIFFMLVLPILVLPYSIIQVIMAFFLMHFILSLVLSMVLLPAHVFEGTIFPTRNSDDTIHEDWALYQMQTTMDYSAQSRILNFFFGGFNLNVVHHLFPKVCHVHLIPISEIVKQTADEFGIIYHEISFWNAIRSHFRMLKILGRS